MEIQGIKIRDRAKVSPTRFGVTGKEGTGKSSIIKHLDGTKLIFDLENKLPIDVKNDENCNVIEYGVLPTFDNICSSLKALIQSPKLDVKWLCFDSVTSIEKIARNHTIEVDYKGDKDKYAAYTRGDKYELLQNFDRFLDLIKMVEEKHNINTFFITHAALKPEKNISGDDYPKLVASLVSGIADSLLRFLHYNGVIIDDVKTHKSGLINKVDSDASRYISFDNTSPFYNAKTMRQDIEKKVAFDIDGNWLKNTILKPLLTTSTPVTMPLQQTTTIQKPTINKFNSLKESK